MQTPSITQQLFDLPEIAADGVTSSIIFSALPEQTQAIIRAESNEQERQRLAVIAGDQSEAVQHMHEHFIAGPARRKAQGLAFPNVATLDSFPIPGLVAESDRAWLRQSQTISRIDCEGMGQNWSIRVNYQDGEHRTLKADSLDEALALIEHVRNAATVLGLLAPSKD